MIVLSVKVLLYQVPFQLLLLIFPLYVIYYERWVYHLRSLHHEPDLMKLTRPDGSDVLFAYHLHH